MAISKVVYNNETLIDISNDSVTRDTLAYGYTAHDKSGNAITGRLSTDNTILVPTKVSDLQNDMEYIQRADYEDKEYIQNGTTEDVVLKAGVKIKKDSLFKVVRVTTNFTQTKTGVSVLDIRIKDDNWTTAVGDGYTPIGVVGYYTGSSYWVPYHIELDALTGVTMKLRRYTGTTTATLNLTPWVDVLFISLNQGEE